LTDVVAKVPPPVDVKPAKELVKVLAGMLNVPQAGASHGDTVPKVT